MNFIPKFVCLCLGFKKRNKRSNHKSSQTIRIYQILMLLIDLQSFVLKSNLINFYPYLSFCKFINNNKVY